MYLKCIWYVDIYIYIVIYCSFLCFAKVLMLF
jgi:hypothetical protein